MYSRGMTTREISEHLKEIYQVEVSADLILSSNRFGNDHGDRMAESTLG
ncbi:transposase, mutator-like family protein [Leptospira weilii serovar Topaz str. LT2116]|uniref:Transposase, mutator-like family protein n=1 Tax=Leptospira weilii serovar Topaz str. LT2116 TaxID=1088540 RepID=M3G980_9LEPT|nr:transposase, mutator-like family protein [Leptospira weilii serovar Topaz str. LT2116]